MTVLPAAARRSASDAYRSDPAWSRAWGEYVRDDLPGTADERLIARLSAIRTMRRIEGVYIDLEHQKFDPTEGEPS